MWTLFWDMHSGSGLKEKWSKIFIEAPRKEAEIIFYHRFRHNPYRVTCTCCGEDYSVEEEKSLKQLTGYHRNCADDKSGKYIEKPRYEKKSYQTLAQYLKNKDVLVIRKKDIKPIERIGSLPRQGYVWTD